MAKIWHFIGLPDPDEPADASTSKLDPKTSRISAEESHASGDQAELPIQLDRWSGPVTPSGTPFHDLGDASNRAADSTTKPPTRSLRYVTPDKTNRLPLHGMISRLNQGDVLFVNLSVMVHMDAHQRACRQSLRHLSNERNLPVFALDEEESLLMMAGRDVHIDVKRYELA